LRQWDVVACAIADLADPFGQMLPLGSGLEIQPASRCRHLLTSERWVAAM
jgi:hypothetical protein